MVTCFFVCGQWSVVSGQGTVLQVVSGREKVKVKSDSERSVEPRSEKSLIWPGNIIQDATFSVARLLGFASRESLRSELCSSVHLFVCFSFLHPHFAFLGGLGGSPT